MDDIEKFKTSVKEVTAGVIKIARELKLEVELDDVTELLLSQIKREWMRSCFLLDAQRKWFLEVESAPGEDAVKTVEMTTKYLEYDVHFVDKVAA